MAGAALLGLTAAGLAVAAPANAAESQQYGPLVMTNSNMTSYTIVKHPAAANQVLTSMPVAGSAELADAPIFGFPFTDATGPITLNGQCLTAQNKTSGSALVFASCTGDTTQQWKMPLSTGVHSTHYYPTNVYSGYYLNSSSSAPSGLVQGGVQFLTSSLLSADLPRALTSPLSGVITPETVFSGTGAVDDVVVITDDAGKVLGTATVGEDGTWTLTLDSVPTNGPVALSVVMSGDGTGLETVYSGSYTMEGSEEPNAYTGPTSGTITPDTVFTGTGSKGETVTITDDQGKVLGTTVIGDDGQWSLTLDPAPVNGDVNLTVKIGDETVANPKVTMTGSDEAPGYSGPQSGDTITPDTVFTGTGPKGETVVITDGAGNVLGETTVGDDGQWSLTLDPAPKNGDVNLIVTVGDEKVADTNVTMTGSDEAPGYSGPQSGDTITPDTVFTGTGPKGETVVITDGKGNVIGQTEVGQDGQWSLTLDPAPKNGDVNLIVTIGDEKVADTNVTMTGSDEARSLTSPAAGTAITPDTEFSGNGLEGDKVTIKDKNGTVLGEAEVGADGTWSTKLSPVPNNGSVDLVIEITGKDNKTETLADNTYEMTESTTKFEVLTPDLAKDSGAIKNGTVFTGKGEPGSTVVITDKDGNTVGNAEVDDQGNWSAPLSGLTDGPNNLTITYTAPGEEPVSNNLGDIVVVSDDESTPLMDPAIAGGAGLALLAAAGSFLLIRRRTAQQ